MKKKPKKTEIPKSSSDSKKEWETAMQLAFAGKIPMLHRAVIAAGYYGDLAKLSTRAIAKIFKVTPQAVGLWFSKNACPRNEDGTYDLIEIIDWKIKNEIKERPRTELEELDEATRKEKLRTLQRNNDIEEGRLVDAEELAMQLAKVAEVFRLRCEIIEKAHGTVVGNDIREAIDDAETEWKKLLQGTSI